MNKGYTCCIFGHRTIDKTEELYTNLYNVIEKLITDDNVDTFLFGSKSQFNDFCLETVTRIKEKYPHIKRIYVRAEYPYINEQYKNYLLRNYEDTYYPKNLFGTGRAVYIKRNYEMINESHFCLIYYNKQNTPTNRKSGTKLALDYAVKKKKHIINLSI